MKLFVGNFPFELTEEELRDILAPYGLSRLNLIRDEEWKSRGFAFAEVDNGSGAIEALDEETIGGRPLRLCPAVDRGGWDR